MPLPDNEAIQSQVRHLAEEARENNTTMGDALKTAAGVDTGTRRIAPVYLGKDHEVIPERYVVHYAITRCANCGSESRDNEFYALSYIRSRVNGTRVRHLTRCDRPLYNLPVDRIPTGKHNVPFCCECPSIDLSHLPPPPEPSQVYDLPEPTAKGKSPRPAGEKTTKPKASGSSLDDLI